MCGRNENEVEVVTLIDFKKLSSATEGNTLEVDQTFGTTWFGLSAVGTSKWVSGSGWSTKSAVVTINVEEASTLSITYYSTSSGRNFTIKKGTESYGEGSYCANDTKWGKTVVIELEAGEYTITFDSAEHKIGSISCVAATPEE